MMAIGWGLLGKKRYPRASEDRPVLHQVFQAQQLIEELPLKLAAIEASANGIVKRLEDLDRQAREPLENAMWAHFDKHMHGEASTILQALMREPWFRDLCKETVQEMVAPHIASGQLMRIARALESLTRQPPKQDEGETE